MRRLMSNTRKPAPARSAVPSGALSGELSCSLAALFCAAALFCVILPWEGLRAQTFDAQAPAPATPAPTDAPAAAPATASTATPTPAAAAAPQRKKSRNPTGSPLDTLMSTRIYADVPEAKDFVRQNRPPPETLNFKPTTGTDPVRPKVRTKAELDALQSELESAAQKNEERAGLRKAAKPLKAPLNLAGAQNGKPSEPKKALPN